MSTYLDYLNTHPVVIEPGQPVEIVPFHPRYAEACARCYHQVYRDTFPAKHVYDPDRFVADTARGALLAMLAATPKGDVVGLTSAFHFGPNRRAWEIGGTMVIEAYRKGDIVAIDGVEMSPATVLTELNRIGGANGIGVSPDGKTLYVADIGAKVTYVYDIQEDGSLARKRVFCEAGSDGMTLDADGRVYLTGKEGVYVFDKAGSPLGVIKIPEGWTANVCIGGPKKDTLFVTASKGVYAVPLKVKGAAQGK